MLTMGGSLHPQVPLKRAGLVEFLQWGEGLFPHVITKKYLYLQVIVGEISPVTSFFKFLYKG